jgi:hypothetical protein
MFQRFTATPAVSPRFTLGGSFRKLGTESKGISSATWPWANRAIGTARHSVRTRVKRFTATAFKRFALGNFFYIDARLLLHLH